MNRLLLATLLAAALAGCKIGESKDTTGAAASCTAVAGACLHNSDCCSYACQLGVCAPNIVEGGTCRTTDDCAVPRWCKSAKCTTYTVGMCRDDADVCSVRSQCCSGNCLGSHCTVNRAPIADVGPALVEHVPYTKVYTLTNGSSDPDGDPITFGWSFLQNPGSVTLSSTTAQIPTFTPNVPGDYVVRLVVTDGPAGTPYRLTSEATVTIRVENTAPVATATAPVDTFPGAPAGTWSRKVPITITGTASDADGDTLQCAWRITEPGTTPAAVSSLTFSPCNNPTANASTTVTPLVEGPYQVDLVVQDFDRGTSNVHNTTIATATFTSRNDPPTAVVSPNPVYANMNGPAPVRLDAHLSNDRNNDAMTFAWEPVSWPGQGTGTTAPTLDTTLVDVATFTPAAEGDYTFLLTVSDPPLSSPPPVGLRPSTSTPLNVTVHVEREVKDFGASEIVDADVAHGVTPAIAVIAGAASNVSQGMIWKLDLATGNRTVVTGTPLGEKPIVVGVSPDGTVAVAASANNVFIVPLDGSTVTSVGAPFTVSDVVVSGDQGGGKHVAYLFPSSSSFTVQILDLANNSSSATSAYGQKGALNPAAGRLYVRESSYIRKYSIGGNGALTSLGLGSYTKSCMGLWTPRPTEEAHIFTGCGDVVAVNTTTLNVTGSLASTSVRHLDTADDGSGAYLSTTDQSILRFDSYVAPLASDALPHWSWDGLDRACSGLFVFTDGTHRRAIVQGAPGNTTRYGLVTFP